MADSTAAAPPGAGQSNADELIRCLVAVTGLSFVFMILRFICKLRYTKGLRVDDALVAFAWVSIPLSPLSRSMCGSTIDIWIEQPANPQWVKNS